MLIQKKFSKQEKEHLLDMLSGCINRLLISDDKLEIVRMVGFINSYVTDLAQHRFLIIDEKKD